MDIYKIRRILDYIELGKVSMEILKNSRLWAWKALIQHSSDDKLR